MPSANCVFIVLDREYGARLAELAVTGPVWIVDSPSNGPVAQEIWAARPGCTHLDGVTTFKTAEDCSPEDTLINELDTIDLHHGVYSADRPYTVLEVIGCNMTERIKGELSDFGFNEFRVTPEGFRAERPLPSN